MNDTTAMFPHPVTLGVPTYEKKTLTLYSVNRFVGVFRYGMQYDAYTFIVR